MKKTKEKPKQNKSKNKTKQKQHKTKQKKLIKIIDHNDPQNTTHKTKTSSTSYTFPMADYYTNIDE